MLLTLRACNSEVATDMEMHVTLSWLMTPRRQLALTTAAASPQDKNCNTYGTYECRSSMESTPPANQGAIIAAVGR